MIPVSFFVPRKSEAFQEDLFPPTRVPEPTISADDWLANKDPVEKMFPLDPAKRPAKKGG